MKISLIIPHYKDQKRLDFLIDRLNLQSLSREHWEVIVVNNDPEVPLALSINNPPNYKINVLEEPKAGSYAARNTGIRLASGEIIGFTDSDCLPDADWLKNAWEIFSKDFKKEIGVLTGPVPLFYRDSNSLSDAEVYEKYTGFSTKAYASEGHAVTANWFSYKAVLTEFGLFDSDLKSNGDSVLSGKISQKYAILFREELVVNHPARYLTMELVAKYKRLIGGTYTRKFAGNRSGFRAYIFNFVWRRYRFALKKFFSVGLGEAMAILRICHAINRGALEEYQHLLKGGDTKR